MSVYIKGMEMPTSCRACPCYKLADDDYEICQASGTIFNDGYDRSANRIVINPFEERLDNCPLIPVPEHGRLIDADALMKTCGMATDCYDCPNGEHGWCKRSQDAANICEVIEDAPTIIPADKEGEG